ncbi:MAG: SH3 domain-containing protein [Candidatus Competibacteraceae bacterium]|nr:SH3 domain-containing protein [Candidatus Competibacteraceae bacterium]
MKLRIRAMCAFMVFALLGLAGCGRRVEGYGVLLWSPDESVHKTGSVVPIYEESRIKARSIIPGPNNKGSLEVESWRLANLGSKRKAESYAEDFAELSDLFAFSSRNALPVRERPDRLSERIYKLRDGEMMKVLEKGTELSDENGLKGYWMRVLTDGGVIGYCFDLYLTLYDAATNTKIGGASDPVAEEIAWILSSNWRPISFFDMINESRVDLSRFKPEYGLFFDTEKGVVHLATPQRSVDYQFTSIQQVKPQVYIAEGSPLQMTVRANGELYAEYSRNNSALSDSFVALDDDIAVYIDKEKARRTELPISLAEKGPSYASSAYGTLTFDPSGAVKWEGFERLSPTVVPESGGGNAVLDFSVFASREAKSGYDGVVNLRFGQGPQARVATFLVNWTDTGFKLTVVPASDIKDGLVQRAPFNPLVLVFSTS